MTKNERAGYVRVYGRIFASRMCLIIRYAATLNHDCREVALLLIRHITGGRFQPDVANVRELWG